jgi:DNA-binding MarR family transcriptional regulator
VTRQVKQLEAEGLISRRDDPTDNRFTLVIITAEGAERLHETARKVREFATQSLEGISPDDLACLRRAMARMRENLEKM